ncbi:hypothetical protein JCM25156A_08910 [Komagataeibacter kakiaceti JCM 25156]
MHVWNHIQTGQSLMGNFPIDKRLWHHTDDLSAICQGGVRDCAHQADVPPSINETDPLASKRLTKLLRCVLVHRIIPSG